MPLILATGMPIAATVVTVEQADDGLWLVVEYDEADPRYVFGGESMGPAGSVLATWGDRYRLRTDGLVETHTAMFWVGYRD